MEQSPRLLIFDVGHGNCALLQDTDAVTVIDCPSGSTELLETLKLLKIQTIDHFIVSHSDRDHLGGLTTVLNQYEEFTVRNVYVNRDRDTDGVMWEGYLRASNRAVKRNGTRRHGGITTEWRPTHFPSGEVEIEILAPSYDIHSSGKDPAGRKLSSNSKSIVVGLKHQSHRVALFAGDIDKTGLEGLISDHYVEEINADILVFPHHGGLPGSANAKRFAEHLCSLVGPKLVVFSMKRNNSHAAPRHDNPRPDIMIGVKSAVPDTHILCTQLSRNCAPQYSYIPRAEHLSKLPAKGKMSRSCCGGTLVLTLNGKDSLRAPPFERQRLRHKNYVIGMVPTPMCT